MVLRALGYYGGKSGDRRLGRWVSSFLPVRTGYCEPFAGMLGVLLCRPRCGVEVVNDLDGRIVEWWRVVRDDPKELIRRLECTPYSRRTYLEAYDSLSSAVGVDLAWAVSVVLMQGRMSSLESRAFRAPDSGLWCKSHAQVFQSMVGRLNDLSDRMRLVSLEEMDACKFIGKWGHNEDWVMYVDPPYRGKGLYGADVVLEDLAEVLRECKCFVGVSGYEGCGWDDMLGWERHDLKTWSHVGDGERVECLWTNQPVEGRLL